MDIPILLSEINTILNGLPGEILIIGSALSVIFVILIVYFSIYIGMRMTGTQPPSIVRIIAATLNQVGDGVFVFVLLKYFGSSILLALGAALIVTILSGFFSGKIFYQKTWLKIINLYSLAAIMQLFLLPLALLVVLSTIIFLNSHLADFINGLSFVF